MFKLFKTEQSAEKAAELAKRESDIWMLKYETAWNTETTQERLENLSKDSSAEILEGVALNPNTSNAVLERLSVNKELSVRFFANVSLEYRKNNGKQSVEVFEKWLEENGGVNSLVALYMAHYEKTPVEILDRLANSTEDEEILEELSSNQSCSAKTYEKLAERGQIVGLICNPMVPEKIKEKIKKENPSYKNKIPLFPLLREQPHGHEFYDWRS